MTVVSANSGLEQILGPEVLTARPDLLRLNARLRFSAAGRIPEKQVRRLVELVGSAVQPRAVYKVSRLTGRDAAWLEIDGVRITNPLIRANLARAVSVYPYGVTLGSAVEEVVLHGPPDRYVIDLIRQLWLDAITRQIGEHISRIQHLSYIWSLAAGEMEAWPTSGNHTVLTLLGNGGARTGITLQTDSSLSPRYSRCGFFYYFETEFEGCQVCSKEPCMMRRAPYDSELASRPGIKIRKVCGKDTA